MMHIQAVPNGLPFLLLTAYIASIPYIFALYL